MHSSYYVIFVIMQLELHFLGLHFLYRHLLGSITSTLGDNYRVIRFKHCCQLLGSILLTVSLGKPLMCFKESLISLTKLLPSLVFSFPSQRMNVVLVFEGRFLFSTRETHNSCLYSIIGVEMCTLNVGNWRRLK